MNENKFVQKQQPLPDEFHSACSDSPKVYCDDIFDRLRMPRAPHWSVAWSDLMMTMFIFFVVLFVYQQADKEIITGSGPSGAEVGLKTGTGVMGTGGGSIEIGNTVKFYDLSKQVINKEELNKFASVELSPDHTIKIILTGDLLFDSSRAGLKAKARKSLAKMIPLLKQTPYIIHVAGYTDNRPINTGNFPSNWELSLLRAATVARFLIAQSGLAENRFIVEGYGSCRPIVANDTPEHRAENRRVEIIISREIPLTSVGINNYPLSAHEMP